MEIIPCKSASNVPNNPKLIICGPIVGLIISAAKPIVNDAMTQSVFAKLTAKKTNNIKSKSGLTLAAVTATMSTKLVCSMVVTITSTANRNQRIKKSSNRYSILDTRYSQRESRIEHPASSIITDSSQLQLHNSVFECHKPVLLLYPKAKGLYRPFYIG